MNELRKITWRDRITGRAAPLSCYGKLPFYRDFISVDGGGKVSNEFRHWLDGAFGKRWEDLDNKAEELDVPRRILFVSSRVPEVAVASVWNSHDSGGLRRFPFAFFVPLPLHRLSPDREGFLREILPLWENMESQFRKLGGYDNVTDFYSDHRGYNLSPEADEKDRKPPRSKEVRGRELDLSLRKDGSVGTNLAEMAWKAARAGRYGLNEGRDMEAVRFPLVPSLDMILQVETWLRFLARNVPDFPSPANLVLPQDGSEGATFTVVMRPLGIEDSRLLSERAGKAAGLLTLLPKGEQEGWGIPSVFVDQFGSRIDREDFTLEKFARYRIPRRVLKLEV